MLELKALDIPNLKGKKKTAIKHLVQDKYRCCLSGIDPNSIQDSELLAVAALWDGLPIGLALGAYRPAGLSAEIYSFQLDEAYRTEEIGSALLQFFEDIVKKKGSPTVRIVYESGERGIFLENLLMHNQWEKGSLILVKCYFDAKAFNPPWLHKKYPVPANCEQFLWKELTDEERKRLEYLVEQKAIPIPLSPFRNEKQIDWKTSLGLRNQEGVIGWMVNHRPSKDLIVYRSLFVFTEYSLLGHAIRLLSESIHLMQKKPPRHAMLEVPMDLVDSRWIKFVKKRLLPYTEKVERYRDAWKKLS